MAASTILDETPLAVFRRAVKRHGGRVAIVCRHGEFTYAELDLASDRVAASLAHHGGPGDRLAILLPQDRLMVIALIGGLKAGRIVTVLNGADPQPRLQRLVDDAEPTVILTGAVLREKAAALAGEGIAVVDIDDALANDGARPQEVAAAPADVAYLVYTSGSTGDPKGVMQTHGQVARDAHDVARAIEIAPDDRVLLVASLWGAQAISTLWATLASGAAVMSFPAAEESLAELADWLIRRRVTVFISAASLFRFFARTLGEGVIFPDMRLVKLSADAATSADFAAFSRHCPGAVLMNAIGCSETHHYACAMYPAASQVPDGRLPVGKALANASFRIVDDDGKERPHGEVGTIAISARHVAAGYWRDPALTARCFFDRPDGSREFRGGDLGFVNGDGELVFAGRSDATYKIRGQRADLAEVEAGIATLPGVADVAVVAVPRASDGELHLVAYVAGRAGAAPSPRILRVAARQAMPRHMVPSFFVSAEEIPRTANGKVDRVALRERARGPHQAKRVEPPANGTEAALARIWAEAFDLDEIGRGDDFFDLGGDSLIAAVIAARIRSDIGVTIDFAAFFDRPALCDLAALVNGLRDAPVQDDGPPLVAAARAGPIPISLLQEAYWSTSGTPRNSRRHSRAEGIRLDGPLDISALQSALADVVARHEMLRARFAVVDRGLVQSFDAPGRFDLPLVDVSDGEDPEGRAATYLDTESERYFDLTAGPPIRFSLVRIAADRHLLVQASHHIVTDGPSWIVFVRDLAGCYEARLAGRSPSLPPLPLQYGDYCLWESAVWHGTEPRLEERVSWWAEKFVRLIVWPDRSWLRPLTRAKPDLDPHPRECQFTWGIDPETSAGLAEIARSINATYFVMRMAAVVPFLALTTGSDRILLGATSTNRRHAELDDVFGPFGNTAPFIAECDWTMTFRELSGDLRDAFLAARAHADVPYTLLLAELGKRGFAIPPMFFWLHMPTAVPSCVAANVKLSWVTPTWYPRQSRFVMRFDALNETDNCLLVFDGRIYDIAAVRRFAERMTGTIRTMAAEPDVRLGELLGRRDVATG